MSHHKKSHPHKASGHQQHKASGHQQHKAGGHSSEIARDIAKAPAASAGAPVSGLRAFMLFVLVVAAFFGAYRFARASTSNSAISAASAVLGAAGAPGGGGGDGCCGGGGAPIEGAATVEGDVQKISVDLSTGSYNPNVIKLKANVPTEITFGQSGGCTAVVASSDLGFQEDLTTGPKTVRLQGLPAGTYNFACGMNMVTGQIVVL